MRIIWDIVLNMLLCNERYIKEVLVMGKSGEVKGGLGNGWRTGAEIVSGGCCKDDTKYCCERWGGERKDGKGGGWN